MKVAFTLNWLLINVWWLHYVAKYTKISFGLRLKKPSTKQTLNNSRSGNIV